MRDLFRVALVHLAAIGLDKKFRHGRAKMIHAQSAFVQDRTQGRHTVWIAIGRACWRKIERASGLFFAEARARSPYSTARNKSPSQHLCAALTRCSLDHLGGSSRQFAGKICAARCGLTFTIL